MAKRRSNDEKAINRMCLWIMETQYKDVPEEQWDEKVKTQKIRDKAIMSLIVADLSDRLIEEYGEHRNAIQCGNEASKIMKEIPQELVPNVIEWLDGKPLSDIKVHGVSINDVTNLFEKQPPHFIQIVRCFIDWKKCNYYDKKNFCRTYFAR